MTPWPTAIDSNASRMRPTLYSDVSWNVYGGRHNLMVYLDHDQLEGSGKFHSIVMNDHFPVITLNPDNSPPMKYVTRSSLPFAKAISTNANESSVILSTIAYYEVTIHQPIVSLLTANPVHDSRSLWQSCTIVGLALTDFNLLSQPGDCSRSYGYRGDNGGLFQSSNKIFDTNIQFGAGDTIGCGLSYVLNNQINPIIFFTKNGKLVGAQSLTYLFMDIGNPLFPVVCTNDYSPLEMNFGTDGQPFLFDVIKLECEIHRNSFFAY